MRPLLTGCLALALTASAVVAAPRSAEAQGAMSQGQLQARLRAEPRAAETVREALRYFRVHPDEIDRLRSSARLRALIPTIAAGYRFDDWRYTSLTNQMLTSPSVVDQNWNQRNHAMTVGAVWDLRDTVFNPNEVQVYGLIGVQRDVMLEVTRTYYARRQLVLRMALRPPEDAIARDTMMLRIDEFTAMLDTLTGGWFSRTTDTRVRGGNASGG